MRPPGCVGVYMYVSILGPWNCIHGQVVKQTMKVTFKGLSKPCEGISFLFIDLTILHLPSNWQGPPNWNGIDAPIWNCQFGGPHNCLNINTHTYFRRNVSSISSYCIPLTSWQQTSDITVCLGNSASLLFSWCHHKQKESFQIVMS